MRTRSPRAHEQDLLWVESPFQEPSHRVVVAAARAGGFGVLDLGLDPQRAYAALDLVRERTDASFGIRVSEPSQASLDAGGGIEFPTSVDTVVVAHHELIHRWRDRGWRVVAEVRSADDARAALQAGANGLVAKGAESGGRVGTTGAFVLGQQVLAIVEPEVPVWIQGGIGPHSAAAAIVAGATGVVLDSQTALLRESRLPRQVRSAVEAMDGSETRVVGGQRVYTRPDLWVAKLDDRTPPEEIARRLGATSLTDQALPAGQDAALASGFAARYGTVGRMVSELRREIANHIQAARRTEPLRPGQGIATELGTRYPVVQGPMTRVSDRARFAAAVADGGGMPFLALALLRGEAEVRPLLEETADLLGDRPWGVGILGFVPKDLRDEQLEVIRAIRPPLALIAGGRPSQAAGLEQVGIRTFLHVPAPGLLERFLKDGARRFVFEGFECGGHVGPRSSFALWESQIEVLLKWAADGGDLNEVDLLFAGGIHDERSAAMVAALAGPLREAGARIGVLMGTAYLFTDEAVAAGAIGEEFQAQALACERTALLESGPGHATRCAESPFVETFAQARHQLQDSGADPQAQWAELEGLNLGRLRLASKGLKRDGDELLTVNRDEQRDEGMFMIGDVATLRHKRTTIDALHESVSSGATEYLATAAEEFDAADASTGLEPGPVDVAIIGMSCLMPGAPDLDSFWQNIVEGVDSITEVPTERWDVNTYFDAEWDHQSAAQRNGSASKWGGFLPDIAFDALAYGIPPASLASIEPTQLLSLKVAADALADAGYSERAFNRERASVIFGAEGGTDQSAAHSFRALYPSYMGDMPAELDDWLPRISEDSFPGLLTNVIAGRIANRLDLGGKNLTVDAACASSLAAVDAACAELTMGSSDMVLCGGADLHNGIQDFLLFTSVHALSTTGHCRTFDAAADGIALGEGVACLVLKRLDDAERDGDRIYGVIRSVAASSDGRSLGLTAPRQEGQERALRRAYRQAQVDARDIGLIEAHGTGTVVGDRTELATLTEVFTQAGMDRASCTVGSVKSNIGHTKCAAGLAGMIKATKAVYHGVLPPTLHVDQPNQAWDPDTSPFVFLDEARPWVDAHRVAGISAFGFGGTNFHVVVESHRDNDIPDRGVAAWPAELFLFRGDQSAVDRALADLAEKLDGPKPAAGHGWRLRDVAAAVSGSGRGQVGLAIVADHLDDLKAKVDHARAGRKAPGVYTADAALQADSPEPSVAFLFPGQGSQRPGMASDLFVGFAEARSLLELGEPWHSKMLPAAAFDDVARQAQRDAVTDTRVAQPTLGVAALAVARLLARLGLRPDMVAGHSYGELVALCVAGAFDERALLELSAVRGEAMLAAVPDGDPGGMVAISAGRERVEELLAGLQVVVANDNHPEQVVVAGPTAAMDETLHRLSDARVTAKRLPVACAFHSPLVAGASESLAKHLAHMAITSPDLPVFSNLTAGTYPDDAGDVRDLLAAQVANEVRFSEEIRAMYEAGARVFVEVGPGRALTGCVERILDDQPHLAVATDRPGDSGVRGLLHALGQLAVAGVAVDSAELFEGREVEPTRWSNPAPTPGWTVNGHLVRRAEGEIVPGGLRPATTVPATTMPATSAPVVSANGSAPTPAPVADGDQALVEYFRAAQQIIGAGHDLILNRLGITPSHAPPAAPAAPAPVAPLPQPATEPAPEPPAPVEVSAASSEIPAPEDTLAKLTNIVSNRTGYPEDMLGADLDIEADLSIDSIKRLEILSELADDLGITQDGSLDELEDLVTELAARKTLQGIVEFLYEHEQLLGDGAGPVPDNGAQPVPESDAPVEVSTAGPEIPAAANRFVVTLVDAPLANPSSNGDGAGLAVRVTGTSSLARGLAEELERRGIRADASTPELAPERRGADLIVVTDLLDQAGLPEFYDRIRPLLLDSTADVVVVAPLGGGLGIDPPAPRPDNNGEALPAGAGIRGLVKTAALEFPDRRIRLVDIDAASTSAQQLADEVLLQNGPVEVAWHNGQRRVARVQTRTGASSPADAVLDRDAVVLLTGGARGITARVAIALAQHSGCKIELLGRSELPEDEEDPASAACADRAALRSRLAKLGMRQPQAIDRECDRILAAREIRSTFAALADADSPATYHRVDVRDRGELNRVVASIYERHGRLDGVVHGAGVLDDHLITDKSTEAFERVFATKVDGARTLLAAIREATAASDGLRGGRVGSYRQPAFVALFGSTAGVLGNRGQVDYAAANDALDAIAAANQDIADRVVAINWGPWSPQFGMVSESLAHVFEAGGMGLIEADDGIAVLLEEIAARNGDPHHVTVARCSPELMMAAFGQVR